MKKINLFPLIIVSLLLASCASQVTVTPEVTLTLPPPTETPLPTLTPTPVAVDGIAEDAEGNKLVYLDGEWVKLPTLDGDYKLVADADGVRALDENGAVKYSLDMENGEWVEAMSQAMQQAQNEFADLGIPTDGFEFKEGDINVWAVDPDGNRVFEMNKGTGIGLFDEGFATEQAKQQDLMPTDIEPRQDILEAQGKYFVDDQAVNELGENAFTRHFKPQFERVKIQFVEQFGFDPFDGKTTGHRVMLNPEINAWGSIMELDYKDPTAPRYLYYELDDGTFHIVPLMPEK